MSKDVINQYLEKDLEKGAKDVFSLMNEARKRRSLEEKQIQAEFSSAIKQVYKIYKMMTKDDKRECRDDDVTLRINDDGHIVGKIGRLYVRTTEKEGKVILEITTRTMPHVSNDISFEEKDYRTKYTQIHAARAYIELLVENGKFKKIDVLRAEIADMGKYSNDEEKLVVAKRLEEYLAKSPSKEIEEKLQSMDKNNNINNNNKV